ncbi:MAG: HAMP domain-containing protein [Nitrospira sp.]|nr:MAG: HAMP domain-containing protein [Nitrospira sp.]
MTAEPLSLQNPTPPSGVPAKPFISLRTKFVVFFSLILVLTCSTLSWYFVEIRRDAMLQNLHRLGTILLTNIAHNNHFRFAGLVAEDQTTLHQYIEGLLSIDEVVYVVVTGSHGQAVARYSKGARESLTDPRRSLSRPIYPPADIVQRLAQTPATVPQITPLAVSDQLTLAPQNRDSFMSQVFPTLSETLYDFALPVLRASPAPMTPFTLDPESPAIDGAMMKRPPVYGVIQIGLTDEHVRQAVLTMIQNVFALTALIIGAGILGAHLLTSRITTPLRRLAGVARQVTEGTAPVQLSPSTNDEVGQLTGLFNVMARSVQERNQAITTNLETIKQQFKQLTTLHQASAAIASTLDMNHLLDTVLQLLVGNLGFLRMVLVLRLEERDVSYIARVTGISPEIAEIAYNLEIPIRDDGSITADLFLRREPVLIQALDASAHRIYPPVMEILQRAGISSFIAVPLQSHHGTLGYIAGDRGAQICTEEDLHILLTIASHVAAAIDNARAYAHLSELTQHQEERIRERTEELSRANDRLQAHDRRRSTFLSVVSHELRTPMTAIRSFAENMLDGVTGPLTSQQTTYLTRIEHNVARLARIINQLLDWSRLDIHKDVLRPEPVCIAEIAATAAEGLQTVAAEKQIALRIEPEHPLPRIFGDRDKLEQILWNLIGNAIKFTPPGGAVTVTFSCDAEGMIKTCVADTGCGIDPLHLPSVFNEFSKVPSSMPSSQGAQLGLFITKTLITMHRGEIWAESTPGRGTCICFTLPIAPPPETERQPQ